MKGRYYLMPMLDGWTDVFQVPGKRTTGTKAQKYAITGPGWNGNAARRRRRSYKSPTDLVWILGRIYCTGTPEDYKAVHAMQDQYPLVPLSAYGKPYTPPPGKVDPEHRHEDAGARAGNRMDAAAYFKLLAALMKDNPPAEADAPMVAKMAKIGIVPGKDFDSGQARPGRRQGPRRAFPRRRRTRSWPRSRTCGHAASMAGCHRPRPGLYGTDYLQRASITAIGLGANRPQDAVYPTSGGGRRRQAL